MSLLFFSAAASSRGALLHRTPTTLLRPAVRMMTSDDAGMQAISGFSTTYKVIKEGDAGAVVAKGSTVAVHATGVVVETGKKFWSTKDPGQQPFQYTAGVGQVITGWCAPQPSLSSSFAVDIRLCSPLLPLLSSQGSGTSRHGSW